MPALDADHRGTSSQVLWVLRAGALGHLEHARVVQGDPRQLAKRRELLLVALAEGRRVEAVDELEHALEMALGVDEGKG